MKINFTHIKFCIAFIFLISFLPQVGKGQTNTYNLYLQNINFSSCRTLDFDIWLEWTGTNTQSLTYFQAGINFNYAALVNGGTITGAFVPGSADTSLPSVQQSPNWNINTSSKQIRMLPAIATPISVSTMIPPPPGLKMGTFRITNTTDFTPGATPNFVFSYRPATSSTTETKLAVYLDSVGTYVTDSASNIVIGNPPFNPNCITSVQEISENGIYDLSIAPNPSIGRQMLTFTAESNCKLKVELTDISGRKIRMENIVAYEGINNKEFFFDDLEAGVYILNIGEDKHRVKSIRLMVE